MEVAIMSKNTIFQRGNYGEISLSTLTERQRKEVHNLVKKASSADKVDEHGAWEFGAEFDKKQRGSALNWDLYAYGKDVHSKRTLIIIQIRQYVKHHKNWYPQVRKSYFLLGRNEDQTVFAHAVESRVIHAAIKAEKCPIRAVQSWIFGADYEKVIRQGDMALIPIKRPKLTEAVQLPHSVRLASSHDLISLQIFQNGNLYAHDPMMVHIPETHPIVQGKGWYKIVQGKRANFWDFAAPTVD
jgi:hypothetical protein